MPPFDPIAIRHFDINDETIKDIMLEADDAVIEAMTLLLPDTKAAA